MANRRLGIEYNVSGFESKGGKDLPSPDSPPVSAEESVNGVEEFRPDFRSDVNASTVKPFLEQVAQDCMDAWAAGIGKEEPPINALKVKESVEVYWLRLGVSYSHSPPTCATKERNTDDVTEKMGRTDYQGSWRYPQGRAG